MSVSNNYDSEFCGSLPIHQINTIQPYGVLLVIDRSDFSLIQLSENASVLLSKDLNKLIGTSLQDYISPYDWERLVQWTQESPVERLPMSWQVGQRSYQVLLHLSEKYLLAEIDLEHDQSGAESFVQVFQDLKYTMSRIDSADSVKSVCEIAASELKRLSGFDKVMIYRFDPDWNGSVVAEAMEAGMEPFLGFTFPASDIPRQARQLYLRNPYRFIPDRSYKTIGLYPVINPLTHAFIDLSDCNLRGVATVHLQYMKNMDAMASMSTRILHEDRLWGLISCHHRESKRVDFHLASVFELLSRVISTRITNLINKEEKEFVSNLQDEYERLVDYIHNSITIETGIVNEQSSILSMLDSGGVGVVTNNKVTVIGIAPPASFIQDLVLWLQAKNHNQLFHTDSLYKLFDKALPFKELASGLLSIGIMGNEVTYILLFRPEFIRVINWGGNPEERILFDQDRRNYHPRNSFRQWQQIVEGVSSPWKQEELRMAENLRSFIYEFNNAGGIHS